VIQLDDFLLPPATVALVFFPPSPFHYPTFNPSESPICPILRFVLYS
jgi:hypothetical protein